MIIGFSGRKQSGKSTAGNFIYSMYIAQLNISEKIYLNEFGEIIVSDILGDKNYSGIFYASQKEEKQTDIILNKAFSTLNRYIKIYNFADILKQNICMNILGLSYDQCYGSDEKKNELTNLLIDDKCVSAREIMQYIGSNDYYYNNG